MGIGHLDRLRRIRALLAAQGRHGAEHVKLACFNGAGFTADLTPLAATQPDVVLVGLERLYHDVPGVQPPDADHLVDPESKDIDRIVTPASNSRPPAA